MIGTLKKKAGACPLYIDMEKLRSTPLIRGLVLIVSLLMVLSMRTQTYKPVQDILVLIAYAINPLINTHASVCSKARGLNGLSLHLLVKL